MPHTTEAQRIRILAISVIERALKDLELRAHRRDATEWIAGRTDRPHGLLSVRDACRCGGVSVTRVRAEAVRRRTGKNPKFVTDKTKRRYGLE